jgi:hypothetical protein
MSMTFDSGEAGAEIFVVSRSRGRVSIGTVPTDTFKARWHDALIPQLEELEAELARPSRRSAEVRARRPQQLRAEIKRRRALDHTNETIARDLGISLRYLYKLMSRKQG